MKNYKKKKKNKPVTIDQLINKAICDLTEIANRQKEVMEMPVGLVSHLKQAMASLTYTLTPLRGINKNRVHVEDRGWWSNTGGPTYGSELSYVEQPADPAYYDDGIIYGRDVVAGSGPQTTFVGDRLDDVPHERSPNQGSFAELEQSLRI